MNGWTAPQPEKADDRCYFFTPEGDRRVRLYVVTASGNIHDQGVYGTPQRAVARKRLQDAREIAAPAKFAVYKTPVAPLLHVFAQGVNGVTR